MRFKSRKFNGSPSELKAMLQKADLDGHGFRREVTTKIVEGKAYYQKLYLYYKIVNCSKIQKTEQEIDSLTNGIFGTEVATELNREIKTRHLDTMGKCKVGLEVVHMNAGRNNGKRNIVGPRERRWLVHIDIKIDISVEVVR